MRATRPSLLASIVCLAFLVTSSGAQAAVGNHPFLHVSPPIYERACGLAFQQGNLYVADYYHDQIVSANETISAEDPSSGPCKLAFDAAGDLYVYNRHHDVVRFPQSAIPTGPSEVIDSAHPTSLAVDRATGDLFVAHRTYISEYEAPIQAGDAPIATIGLGSLGEAYGLAVSEYPETEGDLYVADAADNHIKVFNAAGALVEPLELDGLATPQGRFTRLVDGELLVDNNPESPSYGHLYVLDAVGYGLSDHPQAVLDEFNSQGDYRGQIAGFSDAEPSGIAISPGKSEVEVTSGNSEESAVFSYGPTAPAFTLTAARSGGGGGTVTSFPPGIVCGPACAAEYNEEERITLQASPDPHSDFTGWTVTGPGAEPCPGTGTCTLLLFGDTEVSANFEPAPLRKLEVAISGDGTVSSEPQALDCSTTCAEEFAEGRAVVLTALPAAHSRAVWSGCDAVPSPYVCEVTMSAAKSVSVAFEPIPQIPLAVTVGGSGQGTVTSFPNDIVCPGSACSGAFDEGSTVYLMAAPSPGSSFAGFSGGGCAGTAPLCALRMSAAQSVTATFGGSAAGPSSSSSSSSSSSGASLFRVSSVRTLAHAAILRVQTDQQGVLVASGPGLVPLARHLRAVGRATLYVRLNRHGRRRLRRRGRLALRLSLGFLPSGAGEAAARTVPLRFNTATARRAARGAHGRP